MLIMVRLREFQRKLVEEKIDAVILFWKDPNFFYFFQEKSENSFILIPDKGRPLFFANPLEDVKTSFRKVVCDDPFEELARVLKKWGVKILGINERSIVVRRKKRLSAMVKTRDVDGLLEDLRRTKTEEEIDRISRACKLTEKIFSKLLRLKFKTEGELKRFLKIWALNFDCELSFEPIVASGKNGGKPHYFGNGKIGKGFLIVDFGLKYKGYCADVTRTFYVGNPSSRDLKVYNKILGVQRDVIKMIKPGVKAKELEGFVRKELGSLERYFTHSLGHGIGVKVHEAPSISVKSEDVLEEGMVITIEPALYKGFGIRIEDDVLVTKKGCKLLTSFPKELIIIPKF
jgi:Xaa-Pro aminopeptidase